jgi:hypothetical protein
MRSSENFFQKREFFFKKEKIFLKKSYYLFNLSRLIGKKVSLPMKCRLGVFGNYTEKHREGTEDHGEKLWRLTKLPGKSLAVP